MVAGYSFFEDVYSSYIRHILDRWIPASSSVLEIGKGSARDPHFFDGINVLHLEVGDDAPFFIGPSFGDRGPTFWRNLPDAPSHAQPLTPENAVNVVFSSGLFQRLNNKELFVTVKFIAQTLPDKGTFLLFVPLDPESQDKETANYKRDVLEYVTLLQQFGFSESFRDIVTFNDRSGTETHWALLAFLRTDQREVAVKRFRNIITKDAKSSTYKLALLRAVCAINISTPKAVRYENGYAHLPLGLIVEKWIQFYWDLGRNGRMPRQNQKNQDMSFRTQLETVRKRCLNNWAFFYRMLNEWEHRSHNLQKEFKDLFDQVAYTISKQPAFYIKDEEGNRVFEPVNVPKRKPPFTDRYSVWFRYGEIRFPVELWQELNCISYWLEDSIIMEWARVSANYEKLLYSDEGLVVADIVPLLMSSDSVRDTKLVRDFWISQIDCADVHCVWSKQNLNRKNLVIDHMLPWAWFQCNELWNLVPANASVNGRKSDNIPSHEQLERSRLEIIHSWNTLEREWPGLFRSEAELTLMGGRGTLPKSDWQPRLFDDFLVYADNGAQNSGGTEWVLKSAY